jgi:hypothetical protein
MEGVDVGTRSFMTYLKASLLEFIWGQKGMAIETSNKAPDRPSNFVQTQVEFPIPVCPSALVTWNVLDMNIYI